MQNKNSEISKIINCISLKDDLAEATTNWLEEHFPITMWGRIDWKKVKDKKVVYCANDEDIAQVIKELLKAVNEDELIVCWDNASINPIQAKRDIISEHALDIIVESFDTWIMPVNATCKWCIEIYHEGEVVFGISTK